MTVNLQSRANTDLDIRPLVNAINTTLVFAKALDQAWTDKAQGKGAIFKTMREPEFRQIGAVVRLDSGHTREFQWREELRLNQHLMAVEFGDTETSNFLHERALDESKLSMK